jgi:hypothetical protein
MFRRSNVSRGSSDVWLKTRCKTTQGEPKTFSYAIYCTVHKSTKLISTLRSRVGDDALRVMNWLREMPLDMSSHTLPKSTPMSLCFSDIPYLMVHAAVWSRVPCCIHHDWYEAIQLDAIAASRLGVI